MRRTSGIGGLCLIITCAMSASARADEGLFQKLSFDQAKRTAADAKKRFVLVDFYTTWCGPCKQLDETTWRDQGVKDWLSKEAVCLKIDAEKEEALADKYRIAAYPTILLLRPDGTEIDRLVGYRDAKTFLAEARDALSGNDGLSRARQKLDGANANDPMLRMAYADALMQKGRTEEALSEYLWCFDHGLEHGPAFTGVRLSFLLMRIVQLGQTHPAALDELRKRRDAAGKSLESAKGDFRTAMDFTALNQNLGEREQTLALYDRIKSNKSVPPMVHQYLLGQSLDQLLKGKRYKEVFADTDAKTKVRELISRHEQMKSRFPNDEGLRSYMKRQVSVEGAKYYEALIGAGDKSGAAGLAAQLTEFDPAGAYPELIAAARRAGDATTAEELTRRAEASKKAPTSK
jgi:thiol-disulfide isomerase/thioredoxin